MTSTAVKEATTAAREAETASSGAKIASAEARADFYVKPNGELVPGTGYRYISREAEYIEKLRVEMEIPANQQGIYLSFDKFDTPTPEKLQVPHDASVRASFDTLQIIDDVRVPHGKWGTADHLEPITRDYKQFGPGGATQVITNRNITVDELVDLTK